MTSVAVNPQVVNTIQQLKSGVPPELLNRDQWVLWRVEERNGKPTKVPYSAHNGGRADSTDSSTWTAFDTAAAAFEAGGYDGLGFVFSKDDPYTGIDFDKCVTGDVVEDRRREWMLDLDSYSEYSQSGTGFHVIVKAHNPGDRRKHTKLGVEIYSEGRFFVMTGNRISGTTKQIQLRQNKLNSLYDELFPAKPTPASKPTQTTRGASVVDALFDDQLIDAMFASKNGDRIRALWSGDISGYASHSEADLALMNHLAFYTDRNADRMLRLFADSGLHRPTEKREAYYRETVDKAITKTPNGYRPSRQDSTERGLMADALKVAQDFAEEQLSSTQGQGAQDMNAATGTGYTNGTSGGAAGSQPLPATLGSLAQLYKVQTLQDAYKPRAPIHYLVDGIFAAPSLNITYGAPGTLKSMILLDMAICVASGQSWLEPLPLANKAVSKPIAVKQAPVLWLDLDNGKRRTAERIEAFSRARNLPVDTPLYYVSMPDPWLDASNAGMCKIITQLIKELGAKLVVIDNLGLVVGDVEEISAGMAAVMSNFRQMSEDSGAAVVLIHHQRKGNGTTGRKGETLRGHSSIEASLDLALCVEREEGKPEITLIPTKVRDFDVPTLGAYFSYSHKPGTNELEKGIFFGQEVEGADKKIQRQIENAVIAELQTIATNGDPAPKKGDLIKLVQERLELWGVTVGQTKIGGVIGELARKKTILETPTGAKNTKTYSLPHGVP